MYNYCVNLNYHATDVGLTLSAQLYDFAFAPVGGAVTTGFHEYGDGQYTFHYSYPDGFQGDVVISGGPTVLVFSINPQDAENADVKTSSVSGGSEGGLVGL